MVIEVGMHVEIGLQSDRTRKKRTRGSVEQILSRNQDHPHGVLVKLEDGSVGRVVRSLDEPFQKENSDEKVPAFNSDTVLDLISQEESKTLEFKSSFSWCMKEKTKKKHLETVILKSVSSLANTDGGVLLIGVADNGDIVGLDGDYSLTQKKQNRDGFELRLSDKLIHAFTATVCNSLIDIQFHEMESSKEICSVSVKRSQKPLFVKGESGGNSNAYIRVGNSTRLLPSEELIDYFSNR